MFTFALIGGQELAIILVIVVLLFGASKIPQLMRSLGEGVREFRRVSRDVEGSLEQLKEPVREVQQAVSEAKESVTKTIEKELSEDETTTP